MRHKNPLSWLLATIAMLALVTGCGSDGGRAKANAVTGDSGRSDKSAEEASTPTNPFKLKTVSETFVDDSRVTPATSSQPEIPNRKLVTTITYPDVAGRFPLIVLSHGLTGNPERLTEIAAAWARMGYIVAVPMFPLTSDATPGAATNVGDAANQPADVSFVIDRIIASDNDDKSPLNGKVLTDRIGAAGHSLGGATTYAVAQNDCCRDDRIDAVIIMSGIRLLNPDGDHLDKMPPTMLLHGKADQVLKYSLSEEVYPQVGTPKWFVTLLTAGHSEAYENTPSASDEVVTAATTDFWQAYLPARAGAPDAKILDRLRKDAVVEGISTLQADPG